MADFKVTVEKINIEEHPNADFLELAVIGGYRSVVAKGQFKSGDLAVYIPEQAVLPEWLIKKLGLEGRLAGKKHNRVKAVKLRGILSQGLVIGGQHPNFTDACSIVVENATETMEAGEGDDVTEFLGIVKYEPPIPAIMSGQVFNAMGLTLKYDIENIKLHPDVLKDQEVCVITEKLHGTWACFGYHPNAPHAIVTSKGLSAKGLAFKFVEENKNNLYVRTFMRYKQALTEAMNAFPNKPVYILGEIFGQGVQDLGYGQTEPQFRVFDIYVGEPGKGDFMPPLSMMEWVPEVLHLETVPKLHVGPVDMELVEELTSGKETISGKCVNIREGIVIKPLMPRYDDTVGRVVLKSVSEEYLLRKGNTTEYT